MEKYEQIMLIVMQAVAASSTADQYFLTITEKMGNPDIQVPQSEAYAKMLQISREIEAMPDKAALLMQMLNYGSFSEMCSEYRALASISQGNNQKKPTKLVMACLDVVDKIVQDLRIPRARARMNIYLRNDQIKQYDETVIEIVNMIMSHIPQALRPINGDLGSLTNILDKLMPTASELFLINNPSMIKTLTEAEMATIDMLQLQLGRHLTEMNKQTTDPLQIEDVMDMFTMILENKIAANEQSLAAMGDTIQFMPTLHAYTAAITGNGVFFYGEIPGGVSPSKCAALLGTSHNERLFTAVMSLVFHSVQKYDQAGNSVEAIHGTANAMQALAQKNLLRSGTDRVMKQEGSKFLVQGPLTGYNDLHRQIKDWAGNPVTSLAGLIERQNPDSKDLNLFPVEMNLLTLTLFTIVSACRIRLDATGQTDFETFTAEDAYWLLIVKKLSGQLQNPVMQRELQELAERTIFLGLMSNKDRLTKVKTKDPQLELIKKTVAKAELLVSEVANTLPFIIKDNIFGESTIYQVLLVCLYKALATKNRISRDIDKRKMRRLIQIQVSQD